MPSETLSTIERQLALLIEMPTTSANPVVLSRSIERLEQDMQQAGMICMRYDNHSPLLIATSRPTRAPRLLLMAHIDVVPLSGTAEFTLKIEGSKLKGRGVWDMKFAAACYIELVKTLADEGSLSSYDFGVMFTTDEEVGGQSVDEVLGHYGWRPELTIIPDGGENWGIEEAAKGILHSRLVAHGRSAHGSRPWEGDSALERLIAACEQLRTRFASPDSDGLTVTINKLQGGKATNQIADEATAWLDARAFTIKDFETLRAFYGKLCRQYRITHHEDVFGYPLHFDGSHSMSAKVYNELAAFTGSPVTFSKSYAASDGRWFARHGLSTMLLRPRGGDIHGPDERLRREDLPRFAAFLERVVRKHTRDI